MKPLVDGHGRPIGDVRVSVTDRCNFRCQYCMPAEGLPWLNRADLLSYEEIERLVRLLSAMGVHDVRLTGGEPLVRRELWRLVEKLSAIDEVHDLSLTTNGYLLERQVDDLVRAGLRRVNVSLDALAPDRFFQLTRRDSLQQVLDGLAAAQRHPELRPIKVNVVALRDFTEAEVVRFAEFARTEPYVVRFIEFMPLDADRTWSRDRVLPNEEVRAMIDAVYPLEAGRPRAPRHLAALALRRRQGRDRLHLPRHRAVLRRLQPDPADRRGRAAHLPVLDDRDRPARAAALGRDRRRARDDHPRRRLAQGAQAPRQRPGLRAAGADDVAYRRMKTDRRGARRRSSTRSRRWRPRGSRSRPRPGGWRPRTCARAVDLPPFDRSAMDGYAVRAADTAPGVALRLAGGVAAGEVSAEALAPGTAAAISTGAALPPGADAILQSELATVGDGTRDARAGARAGRARALPRRGRARGRRAGARGRAADAAAAVRAGVGGRGRRGRASPPAAAPARHGVGAAAARRAARAGPDPRVQRADGDAARGPRGRGARRRRRGRPTTAPRRSSAVERGLAGDVLVVSGGVSVGPHDHVKPAFEACGVDEVLWRVRIKPGKPMWFGRRGSTLVFGLPGNPLSSIVCFCVFIEPALRRLQGERDARPRLVPGRLAVPAGPPTAARRS